MSKVRIDFANESGKIKPMNAVNNGPKRIKEDQVSDNVDTYAALRIPYARTHDSAHCHDYGGPYTIDITGIFQDFKADENDPASYDFVNTDEYLTRIEKAGTHVFYRLGQSIEHTVKKHGTIPPADFHKWARICEHIIRHVNYGWADGMNLGIEYWEIWNEPDLDADDSKNKRCWGGTQAEFFDFFEIAAKHLKGCFPELKIGGPAVCGRKGWSEVFLPEMKKRNVPLDFFSWHIYSVSPESVARRTVFFRNLLDASGYSNAESILNEWNYVKDWTDNWIYSLRAETGPKGAAFATAVISLCQYSPVDMLMYYDARPSGMNGLFDDVSQEPIWTYYPFYAFADMAELGQAVKVDSEAPVYACAAKGEIGAGILFTYYSDDDAAGPVFSDLDLSSLPVGSEYEIHRLNNSDEVIIRGKVTSEDLKIGLKLNLFDIIFFKITKA
ncbi:MAG: hypothetical protein K5647_00345 [Clostridiales bacterium]|nr:hypothetical protein [Clostridiales bacterium]